MAWLQGIREDKLDVESYLSPEDLHSAAQPSPAPQASCVFQQGTVSAYAGESAPKGLMSWLDIIVKETFSAPIT